MSAHLSESLIAESALAAAIQAACDSIAPTWPLDRMIAVNPYWGRIQQPFDHAAHDLATIAGSPMAMPFAYYRERWEAGEINESHLARAIAELQAQTTVQALLNLLEDSPAEPAPAPLLCDALDRQRDLSHEPAWCDTITHQISQFCAAYFDRAQAGWHPEQQSGLYSSWRSVMMRDHSVALLMRVPGIPDKAGTLPDNLEKHIAQALTVLGIPNDEWDTYLHAVMMRVNGWASWCAYRRWQARLAGSDDQALKELLAIRLGWECLIDDGARNPASSWQRWRGAWREHFQEGRDSLPQSRLLWQRAEEIAYQQKLCVQLASAPKISVSEPKVQAVFCIDVRSEVFRRHFEAQSPQIQTLGFAGFFGLPISYTPLGTQATRPQLPGLLAPALDISESTGEESQDARLASRRTYRLRDVFNSHTFQTAPASAFALVESLGLGYASKLVQRSLPGLVTNSDGDSLGLSADERHGLRPILRAAQVGGPIGQAELAVRVLAGMQLTKGFAPLVLLIGHGSQTQNNPQRAGLDCGACCGQTGEVNARVLAGMLNDAEVRRKLVEQGIAIPSSTRFVAGLHNTVTDEVLLFDADEPLDTHVEVLTQVRAQLAAAAQAARRERAPLLGLQALVDRPEKLLRALRHRASDWAQTRPEWGLANNAAFIVAPRSVTRGINLAGRSFLHEYDYRNDPDGALLEQVMTAPMIVTHWINMQYYASTVDNIRYGSGNKTLHNVVGGRLGVFEGNGGDLRIGLAWQSVHDGQEWRHAPLRLTVVIEAPRVAIEQIISAHASVRDLVCNKWLYLARLDGSQLEFYHDGGWKSSGK
jgi:uncharacterized protein